MNYDLTQMSPEDLEAMTAEIEVILTKYNAEIGVTSQLRFLKRQPTVEVIPSPYGNETEEKPNTPPEEGSESGGGESSKS